MYEYIYGMITDINPKYIVIEANGIGYLINVSNPYSFRTGEFIKLYVYLQIREDSHEFFGFHTKEEKDLFLKLISVNGIGPRSAMPVLASGTVSEISQAILAGNAKYLQKFPGIGPKASQQIILDLQGKLEVEPVSTMLFDDHLADCEEALVSLGYNKKDVKKALDKIDTSQSQDIIIKEALRILSRS